MCVIKSNPYETAREWHQTVDTGVRLPSRILEATFHTCQIELSTSGFMSHLKLEPQVQFLSQRRCSLDLVKWNWSYFPPLRLWSQWDKLQSKIPKIRSWLLRNVEWNIEANTNHPLFLGLSVILSQVFPQDAKQASIHFPFDLVQFYEISLREKRKYYPESSNGSRT